MANDLVTYDEKWAQKAERAVAAEPLSMGTWLTAKGGTLTIGETQLPGNQAPVIVLDSVRENTYYGVRYDADAPLPPVCYALGRDVDPLFPHLDMQKDQSYFMPQHWQAGQVMGCDGCPRNEWGSADQGRGKACQNRRRLTVIPAGFYVPRARSRDFDLELFTDPKHFQQAEAAFFKLPVTSVTNWAKYVNHLAQSVRRPPYGVVTRIHLEPHAQHQYEVQFEPIELVPDELADILMARQDTASRQPLIGYAPPDPERLAKAAPGTLRGGFRR
jgi:hypothetical protein